MTPQQSGALRLLVVSSARRPWGAERSLRLLITDALRNGELRVDILTMSAQVEASFEGLPGVRFVRFHSGNGRAMDLIQAVKALHNAPSYDSILVFSIDLSPLAFLKFLTRWNRRTTYVLDVHDVPTNPLALVAHRILSKFYTRRVFISRYVARSFRGRLEEVVPRPFVMPTIADKAQANDRVRVGIVGRVDPEKRIELAIAAVELLPPQISLEVYGEPLADPEYSRGVIEYGSSRLGSRFTHHGREAPEHIFPNLDMVICCNPDEPSGRSIGEAMSWGLPVVVPDAGGAPEFVEDGVTGRLFASNDPASAAASILWILSSGSIEIGLRARQSIEKSQSVSVVAPVYVSAIK